MTKTYNIKSQLIPKKETFMKQVFLLIVALILILPDHVFADTKVIAAEGEYVMGKGETMEVAEERAKKAAIQSAAEKAGVFVKSYTKVKNLALEDDVIEVIANHSMKVKVLDVKKFGVGSNLDAIKFYVKIEAAMTEEEIEANLKKVREDQSIVDSYNRLKADYEKQNKEMEHLKNQLELTTGGDKQKITKLISEEEKKYKATLWLERAQQTYIDKEEQLKAYKKALELDPDMPEAYVGIAKVLKDKYLGELIFDKEKLEGLKKAMENLNKAIALDENYAEAYAVRANILHRMKSIECNSSGFEKLEEIEKDYDERTLKDIDRALALNVLDKKTLYYLKAHIYLEEIYWEELKGRKTGENHSEAVEALLDKALVEIDKAISLCSENDLDCLRNAYMEKADAYANVEVYYARQGNSDKGKKIAEMINQYRKKAEEFDKLEKAKAMERDVIIDDMLQTEYGKIEYYLDIGWREKVMEKIMGISFKGLEEKNKEEQDKIQKEIFAKIKKKIQSGTATAEEYLFMYYVSNVESPLKEEYFRKGTELLEKRNPVGIDALLNVYIYSVKYASDDNARLSYLNKEKAIVDKNLPQASKPLSIDKFISLDRAIKNTKSDADSLTIIKKLNKQQSESAHWYQLAMSIAQQKAEIYEKLDLPMKAREEYLYLCETFKDDNACKSAERLKK